MAAATVTMWMMMPLVIVHRRRCHRRQTQPHAAATLAPVACGASAVPASLGHAAAVDRRLRRVNRRACSHRPHPLAAVWLAMLLCLPMLLPLLLLLRLGAHG